MGKTYPEWLIHYYEASRGNAKYDGTDNVDSDDICAGRAIEEEVFSPARVYARPEDEDKENSPAGSHNVNMRRGKVTERTIVDAVKVMEKGADARAQLFIEAQKADSERMMGEFRAANTQFMGGLAAFSVLFQQNPKE